MLFAQMETHRSPRSTLFPYNPHYFICWCFSPFSFKFFFQIFETTQTSAQDYAKSFKNKILGYTLHYIRAEYGENGCNVFTTTDI